jgi:predicted dehydrogenase
MRSLVRNGTLGEIRMIDLQYTHGFGNDAQDDKANDAQKWRVDPKVSGPSFVLGDLSTHTYYISHLVCPEIKIKQLLCDRQSFVKSRAPLEDNAYVLMRYDNGAVGRMWASAVDAGRMMTGHHVRIVGSKASVEYNDARHNELIYEVQGQPPQTLFRGMPYLSDEALADDRCRALHNEGLMESWANIYLRIALAIDAKNRDDTQALKSIVFPDIDAGIDGIRWVQNCVKSANAGAVWVDFE